MLKRIFNWFDNDAVSQQIADTSHDKQAREIDWWRVMPFIWLHLACLGVYWVGFSWFALGFAIVLYAVRMFAVTGFYHRYFSHKAFRTSRTMQFFLAVFGATAVQRGPLWWASHHRHHHVNSDAEEDAHSPVQHGFLWSHLGWFLSNRYFATDTERVKEFNKYFELRWLDRFDIIVPTLLAIGIYCLGEWLAVAHPTLQTDGLQLLVWGFAISTVALYHATFTVNSLAHIWGKRRYATRDQSRNNIWIALFTLGEGWHNNHHHYPGAAKQGFYWWEVDFTYYGLRLLAACGLIWDLRKVPLEIREYRKIKP